MENYQYIIVYGNPLTGFTFRGPFQSEEEAMKYADNSEDDQEWWIADLAEPVLPAK